MVAQIKMPALSPTMTEGKLSKWLIQKSSKVVSGDVIAEIETDKATMEIEAVDDGVLYEIFVEEGTDQKSILDNNNKEKSLRDRTLVGINLINGFKYIDGAKKLSGGKIYDPGRGRTFKSNIYLLQNGNLKIEGCLLRMCGHEEWKPITVTFNDDGTKKVELKENL